jgi:TrmH RNA methyltransferase
MAEKETKIYGRHACHAVFAARCDDIVRVLLEERCRQEFHELLEHCAAQRKAFRVVSQDDLEKVAGSRHHEGICIVCMPRWSRPLTQILQGEGGPILALDQVGNPHNIGSLLRTAVHFGARAVLLGGKSKRLSSAAYRTAEGAAEHIDVCFAEDLAPLLQQCQEAGFVLCATSSHKGKSVFGAMPAKSVILLGAERDGLSPELMSSADQLFCIPGTGKVESLNVAASTAVLLAEHWRTHSFGDGGTDQA